MNLSPDILSILKNFSSINQSIVFRPGKELSTISAGSSILAIAKINEKFPKEFGIYDLNQLLSAMSLFPNPELDIEDSHLIIKDGKRKSVVYFTDETMIACPPKDMSKIKTALESAEIKFLLPEDDFNTLMKGAGVFGSPEFSVDSKGDIIHISATDTKNPTSNHFSISLGEGNGKSFHMVLKTDNLKLLKGSYEVSISSKGISHFKNVDMPVEYFISLDQSSRFDG